MTSNPCALEACWSQDQQGREDMAKESSGSGDVFPKINRAKVGLYSQ